MQFCRFTDEECIFEDGNGDCSKCDYNYTRNENTCICCGKVIPEGRQVCYQCENKGSNNVKLTKEDKIKFRTEVPKANPIEIIQISEFVDEHRERFAKEDLKFMYSCIGRRCENY